VGERVCVPACVFVRRVRVCASRVYTSVCACAWRQPLAFSLTLGRLRRFHVEFSLLPFAPTSRSLPTTVHRPHPILRRPGPSCSLLVRVIYDEDDFVSDDEADEPPTTTDGGGKSDAPSTVTPASTGTSDGGDTQPPKQVDTAAAEKDGTKGPAKPVDDAAEPALSIAS
jgi:hypothetical protein